jgi:hypothetical protein
MSGGNRPTYELYDYDLEILKELPFEDDNVGRVLPMAVQVGTLKRGRLGQGGFTSASLTSRLKALEHYGYVKAIRIPPLGKGMGYQLTRAGREYLNGRKENE